MDIGDGLIDTKFSLTTTNGSEKVIWYIDTENYYHNGDGHAIGIQGGCRNLYEHNIIDGAGGSGIHHHGDGHALESGSALSSAQALPWPWQPSGARGPLPPRCLKFSAVTRGRDECCLLASA